MQKNEGVYYVMGQAVKEKLYRQITKILFDYELSTKELHKVENTFLGRAMIKSVESISRRTNVSYDDTDEDIKELVEAVSKDIVENVQSYLRKKLHIDLGALIAISSLYYEGAEAHGNIYFALEQINEKAIEVCLTKEDDQIDLEPNNWKTIRKWLEITNGSDEDKSRGLLFMYKNGKWTMKGIALEKNISSKCLRFCFQRHMKWKLYQGKDNILNYSEGHFSKPLFEQKQKFEEMANAILQHDSTREQKTKSLWELVDNAIAQKHGTILVILFGEKAQEEADRICKDSTGTRAQGKLNDAIMVKRLTAVDGAVLIDEYGNVLAYGVILDSVEGINVEPEPGRGSRFLSGQKYAKSLQKTGYVGLVVIVSEDGMVNFYSTERGDVKCK